LSTFIPEFENWIEYRKLDNPAYESIFTHILVAHTGNVDAYVTQSVEYSRVLSLVTVPDNETHGSCTLAIKSLPDTVYCRR
jgi:hypothetical protein